MKAANFTVLDEISMFGKRFMGKIVYRVQDTLGKSPLEFGDRYVSMSGMDCVLNGHMLQAKPIGDLEVYREASTTASRKARTAASSERSDGAPSNSDFGDNGELFFKEFEDVVILRTVHRTYDGGDDRVKALSEEDRERFLAESARFQEVMERMSDLTWSAEDHAWLVNWRNKSVLARTREGREVVDAFEESMILMDTRKQKQSGEDGADRTNAWQLRQCAQKLDKPILEIKAAHDRPSDVSEKEAQAMEADEFKGLSGVMQLCEGALVLLTHNLWVEAGLTNGARGVVRGFVFPADFDPNHKNPEKRVPVCVIVEFSEVNLNVGGHAGKPRTFFPERPGCERWVPIFHETIFSNVADKVTRKQFPLILAWALTHWKAQGMTLEKVRIALGGSVARSLGVGYMCCTRVKHPRDLMFEFDFPDYEAFQGAKHSAGFRARRRFELRLQARASETILKYAAGKRDVTVVCEGDPWNVEDANIALTLLDILFATAQLKREQL